MKLTADFALRFLHFLDTLESFILFLNFFGVVSELKSFWKNSYLVHLRIVIKEMLSSTSAGRRDFCRIALLGSHSNY